MSAEHASALRVLGAKIGNMLARGKVTSIKPTTKMQTLQLALLDEESKDRMEHYEPYGFTSHPHPGAEALAAFLDGDRSHGVVIVVADRKYRLKTLREGEVVIHDDLDQKVHLTRDGIVIEGGGLPMIIRDTPSVLVQADDNITFETARFVVKATTSVRFETPLAETTQLFRSMQYTMGTVPGGAGALAAAFGAGTMTWTGVNLVATGGSLKHDAKNIGSTHTHPENGSGGGTTSGPNP